MVAQKVEQHKYVLVFIFLFPYNMNMKRLHQTQKDLLDLLKDNQDEPLTVRDIQRELGLSTTSLVTHHINQLEKKGYLKRNPSNPRDFTFVDGPKKQVAYLNLYGLAQCGPNGSVLDGNPVDRVPVASRLIHFATEDAFLVEAKGDSMEPKIAEGDLVLVKKTNDIDDGSMAVCVNDGEALIKKVHRKDGKVILESLNHQKYKPFLANDDIRIEGEVKGVISHNL